MDWLKDLFHRLTDVETMVRVGGLTAMTIIVFAETGLLVGFFLPGDSLLVTAGVFAATGQLNLLHLNLLLIAAAILGDTVGYWFGRKTGPALFRRPKSLLFNPEHRTRCCRLGRRARSSQLGSHHRARSRRLPLPPEDAGPEWAPSSRVAGSYRLKPSSIGATAARARASIAGGHGTAARRPRAR